MLPSSENKNKLTRAIFVVIIMFTSLAQVAADMYTPSLPYIAKSLGTNSNAMQLTMSIYMLGFSLSHLYYGPLSDRIGRKPPILNGIILCMLGSLFCFLAPSGNVIIIGRFIQGMGMGACSSVGRPLLRDYVSGGQLAKLGSHLGMINVFVVASAPALGGYIQHYLGWRANFIVLFLYSGLTLYLLWKMLPETNHHLNPQATQLKPMLANYRIVLASKTFIGYTLCSCFAYAGLIAYMTVAPFLMQSVVGLSPVEFGWLSFLIACSFFLSTFINARWVLKWGIAAMVLAGSILIFLSGLLMLCLGTAGFLNTWVIMLPVAILSLGVGFTFANAFAGAFHPFPTMSGSAGALYGFIQVLGASVASALMATLHASTQIPLAIMLTLLGLFSLISLITLAR